MCLVSAYLKSSMERFIDFLLAGMYNSKSPFKIQYGEIYSCSYLSFVNCDVEFKIQYGEIYSLIPVFSTIPLNDLKSSMERFIDITVQTN